MRIKLNSSEHAHKSGSCYSNVCKAQQKHTCTPKERTSSIESSRGARSIQRCISWISELILGRRRPSKSVAPLRSRDKDESSTPGRGQSGWVSVSRDSTYQSVMIHVHKLALIVYSRLLALSIHSMLYSSTLIVNNVYTSKPSTSSKVIGLLSHYSLMWLPWISKCRRER